MINNYTAKEGNAGLISDFLKCFPWLLCIHYKKHSAWDVKLRLAE
jgi:hypothetical protein